MTNRHHASRQYLAAKVEGGDTLHRVTLLHEGAARFTREAIRHIESRNFEPAHEAFVKAKRIVLHLLSSIPDTDDTKLAADLRGLFQYACDRLIDANLHKDPEAARCALGVLRNLAEGWSTLDTQRRTAPAGAERRSRALVV